MRSFLATALLPTGLLLAGCGPSLEPVTVRFAARVGAEPFECGRTYMGLGATGSAYTAQDLRIYVHDVRLVRADGSMAGVELDPGAFSDGEVALLDFEDGGECDGGNVPTNTTLVGRVEAGDYIGIRFTIGVPAARNHLDSATAPSPLNFSSMYWGWMDGYKFIRIEGRSTGMPGGTLFHLGSTGCTGDARMGTRVCANGNRGEIALDGFDPMADTILVDLASMYASVDLDADAGGNPGCMSAPDDPECALLFAAVGIGGGPQTLFRVERE